MFDKDLVISILTQIDEALEKVLTRAARIRSADDFHRLAVRDGNIG